MNLEWYPEDYWAWRLPAGETGPDDAFTVMRTPDETTVITTDENPPPEGERSGPWRLFRIADTLPHDAVGILARLSGVLAGREIPILAFGSYDTDYVFIPAEREADARDALSRGGYVSL